MKYSIYNSRTDFNMIEVIQSDDRHGHTFRSVAEFLSTRIDEDVQIVQNTSYDQKGPLTPAVELPRAEEMANTFIAVLQAWLTLKEMQEIRERNQKEIDSGICHSHDFCDANIAMEQAFNMHGIRTSLHSEEHQQLWNQAWDLAKGNNFRFINS